LNEGQIKEQHKNSMLVQHFWLLSSAVILLNMTVTKDMWLDGRNLIPGSGFAIHRP
jgi:hypothetical protein